MPLPLAAIGLGISAVGSLAQAISGESRRVKAKRALENFQRQELKNVTEGLRVSTLGAELQTEAAQQRFATSVDALRSGGVRGLVGGLGRVEQAQGQQQRVIAADLDRQQMQIDRMGAMDEARIRQMQEQRESAQIAGLGSEMAAGARSVQAGLGGLASTGVAAAQIGALGGFGEKANKIKKLSTKQIKTGLQNANQRLADQFKNQGMGGILPVQAQQLEGTSVLNRGEGMVGSLELTDRGDFGNLYGFDNSNNPYN